MKLYLFIFLLLFESIFSQEIQPTFSSAERYWIEARRGSPIEIYLTKNNGILNYSTKDGSGGIFPSLIKILEERTGLTIKTVEVDEKKLKDITQAGVPDIIFGLKDYKKNEDTYYYRDTPIELNGVLLTREESPVIDSQTSLSGKRVVIVRGNSILNKAHIRYGSKMTIILKDSVEEAAKTLLKGEADIYIENLPETLNYITNNPKSEVKINYLSTSLRTNYQIGVKKEYKPFLRIMDKIFHELDVNKDFLYDEMLLYLNDGLKLSRMVREYLEKTTSLDVYLPIDRDLYPLFYTDENGEEAGFLSYYFKDIEKMLGVKINFGRGTSPDGFNINPLIVEVGGRELNNQGFLTTEPYYEGLFYIFNRKEEPFIPDPTSLGNYSLAAVKTPVLINYYKTLGVKEKNIKFFPTQEKAIEGVSRGEADLFISDLRWADYLMKKIGTKNLKVAGVLPERVAFKFGISSKDEILHLIISSFEKKLSYEFIDRKKRLLKQEVHLAEDYKLSLSITLVAFAGFILLYLHLKRIKNVYGRLRGLTIGLVGTLESANSYKDEDTGTHVKRINHYSELLALELRRELKLSKKFIEDIGLYASLHDIGKIGIPDSILKKPGKLTQEEFDTMKRHSDIGYKLIGRVDVSPVASNLIRFHHERWNGKGYPLGLSGDEIPIEARIVALADVYDALRQERVYKRAFSHEKTVEIILSEEGKHFDPQVVEAFKRVHKEFNYIFENN
ncbi:metal-dependent phosphohydrolase [Propionigenium maris DSM 9537]|uniref:Metal-dependent phosphohydrolase n=1 Tax=Propionigenium maris DSM 9537 TaxID=1123000 RepID=A0A9W6LPY5_9FUSO|nr:HD domain-containing phosphohydrolase [Propionigenium maris]GLI58172.1 metal-dependent phosphohydrolase [Propionigenium maris DSM 9537]